MIPIKLNELLEATKGVLINHGNNPQICSISTDSRKIKEGDLFIPIVGERFDGHSFINKSLELGAIATLTDRNLNFDNYSNKTIIKVENTTTALQDISKLVLNKLNIPVIGITGSTGKTSTKELIYNVLSQNFKVLKNQGNYNNHIGLPLTLLDINQNHEIVVVEMGMSGRGEIDTLAKLANPTIGVITNIGLSHIEKLGSQKEIFNAKMEISNYMDSKCSLVLNGDDKYLKQLKKVSTSFDKFFVGFHEDNDMYVTQINNNDNELEFQISYKQQLYDFKLNVHGEHNVSNSLLAISVGLKLNLPMEMIKKGIEQYSGSKMRLNLIKGINNSFILNDCYNASPDSMMAALKVLKSKSAKRKIAILGDMLEMGQYSEKAHKDVGSFVKENNVDILITIGKYSKFILEGAIESGISRENTFLCNTNKDVVSLINTIIQEKDLILIKGSRGMKMEEIVQSLQERS